MSESIKQNNSIVANSPSTLAGEVLEVLGKKLSIVPCVKNEIYNFLPDPYTQNELFNNTIDDIQNRLKYFSIDEICQEDINFLIIGDDRKIVGFVGLQENPHSLSTLWLRQVSIDTANYKKQGLGKKLLSQALIRAIDQGYKNFEVSSFTKQGKEYLPRELYRLQDKYPNINILVKPDEYRLGEVLPIKDYCVFYGVL